MCTCWYRGFITSCKEDLSVKRHLAVTNVSNHWYLFTQWNMIKDLGPVYTITLQQIRKHLFAFLLPFSWCLHSYANSRRALSLLDEDLLLQAWLLYSRMCLLRKKLLAQLLPPKKSSCGVTTKLSCYWTSRQTTRLQKQLKAWIYNTPRLLCARVFSFWRLHVESCRFQVVVFKSFHFEMRFQVVVFKLSFSCKREVHPQRSVYVFRWKRNRVNGHFNALVLHALRSTLYALPLQEVIKPLYIACIMCSSAVWTLTLAST